MPNRTHLQGTTITAIARPTLVLPLRTATAPATSVDENDITLLSDLVEQAAAGGLIKRGPAKATIAFDPATIGSIPVGAAPETWKIQYPPIAGQTTGDAITFVGWIKSVGEVQISQDVPTVDIEWRVNSVDTRIAGT